MKIIKNLLKMDKKTNNKYILKNFKCKYTFLLDSFERFCENLSCWRAFSGSWVIAEKPRSKTIYRLLQYTKGLPIWQILSKWVRIHTSREPHDRGKVRSLLHILREINHYWFVKWSKDFSFHYWN